MSNAVRQLRILPQVTAETLEQPWLLAELIGRLVEITGQAASARLSWVVQFVAQAQRAGETVAWIQPKGGSLFPPDLQQSGVNLATLPVIRLTDTGSMLRAADILLRSGGFGVVVLDLTADAIAPPSDAQLGRLLGLAQKHNAIAMFVTGLELQALPYPKREVMGKKPTPWHETLPKMQDNTPNFANTLGSLVSLRLDVRRHRLPDGSFVIEMEATKDKRKGPGRTMQEKRLPPQGVE